MVLRKDRPPTGVENSCKMSNEQPVTKRQRIEPLGNEPKEPESNASATHIASTSSSSSLATQDLSNVSLQADEIDNGSVLIRNNRSISFDYAVMSVADNGCDLQSLQTYLANQCLCGVTDQTLKSLFQSQYSHSNGVTRVASLCEWTRKKLLEFLSNIQLLFDVYLKQNSTGSICGRIKDVCDALILNERNLISDIIDLSNYNDKFVQFIAGKLIASFLVIAKDSELSHYYLKKLIDNLFSLNRLNEFDVQKINFTLDIFKRIIEWKDVELHPLGDDCDEPDLLPVLPPPIENNYFHYSIDDGSISSTASTSDVSRNITRRSDHRHTNENCHLEHLTDWESFDTTNLKGETVKILANKWRALLETMKELISRSNNEFAEYSILTFLSLWESIISIQANLSVIDTHPFHAQLQQFAELLNSNLSTTVYKQMLSLFNEALCYGSTLALQDTIPDETSSLATTIIRRVKLNLLNTLPQRQQCTDGSVSLIGYNGSSINYKHNSFEHFPREFQTTDSNPNIDRTLLQKLVLLVLKSVAVTVREIRSDSSDGSMDTADAQSLADDLVKIEKSMREVVKKVEMFLKNKMEFHPATHFSKILIDLFGDQDDYLIESMVCTLDVVIQFSYGNNTFPELISMMNPVYVFLEFLAMIRYGSTLLLDLLVSNETCFLLYLLRFLKYIRANWTMFITSCHMFKNNATELDRTMLVLKNLRTEIAGMVATAQYPYDITPILNLLRSCGDLHEGNELNV
ncbi:Protein lines [Pseudolycoriella hygida]|uniref:Protein lines n=1 Tax=Pseudolycoriella hygida TaxID=35572 RepID=A0A9Q0NFJ4_9DIPT|nr:Protein lines [Pseudolycoriella hygida]